MTETFNPGMLTHSSIDRGVDLPLSAQSDWQRKADGWTISLASDLTEPGIWPTFHYWKGVGHKGEPPTVADLIYSVVSDCSYLESEPEEVSYPTGKAIEHSERKMIALFGFQFWQVIKAYSEEEIETAFGEFS